MKIIEVPDQYKIYKLLMRNNEKFFITGEQKNKIMESVRDFIQLPNGDVINKRYIVSMVVNFDLTRDNVQKNADAIKNAIQNTP